MDTACGVQLLLAHAHVEGPGVHRGQGALQAPMQAPLRRQHQRPAATAVRPGARERRRGPAECARARARAVRLLLLLLATAAAAAAVGVAWPVHELLSTAAAVWSVRVWPAHAGHGVCIHRARS